MQIYIKFIFILNFLHFFLISRVQLLISVYTNFNIEKTH